MRYRIEFKKCTRSKFARAFRAFFFSEMHYTGREAKLQWPKLKNLEPDTLYEVSIKL